MTTDGGTGKAWWLLDRTAVLFLGVGIAIGMAFAPGLQGPATASRPPANPATPAPMTTGTALALPLTSTQECAVRYAPSLSRALTEGRPVRIAVLGDSFGDGLWWSLYNQLPQKAGFEVLRYSQQSTGFTRYASLNLEDRLAERLAEGPIDIAVISFGANDTQGIYANGHGAALLTPAWQAEIGEAGPDVGPQVRWIAAEAADPVQGSGLRPGPAEALLHHPLVVGQGEIHQTTTSFGSRGRPSPRSEMMFFWIWAVPPPMISPKSNM